MIDVTFSIPARDNLEINYAARLAIEEAGKIDEAIRLIKARLNVDEIHLTYDAHGNLWA